MNTEESGRPQEAKARQLCDTLRSLIEEGEWPDGHEVPSQADLVAQYGMSTRTVRDAVIWLAEIGRVRKSHGKRTRIYMPAESPHRIVLDQREPSAEDLPRVAQDDTLAVTFVPARRKGPVHRNWDEDTFTVPAWDALRLGLDTGTKLLRRTLTVSVGGEPVLTSASLVPVDLVDPVAWHDVPVGELALAGVSATFDRPEVHCRIPTLAESWPLNMVSGVPVLAIYRRCRLVADHTPAPPVSGCVLVVARADRVHL